MRILGLSFGYHDASVSIVENGKVLFASAEERFTRQKHDAGFPWQSLSQGLLATNTKVSDISNIVYHEDPFNKFSRVLTSSLKEYPFGYKEFAHSMKSWMGKKLWTISDIASSLPGSNAEINYLSHHYSHALQAFLGSGFNSSAILVVDAVGDWSCSALFRGIWRDGKPDVVAIKEVAFPQSLGLVYSAVTAYLGFIPNDSEANTMALAAFGRPKYVEEFEEILAATEDGYYSVKNEYFNFTRYFKGAVTEKFFSKFGPARDRKKTPLHFDSLTGLNSNDEEAIRFADIACSFQTVFENRVLDLARILKEITNENFLCYAGGSALNCMCNRALAERSEFNKIYIPPDPGDGGTSVGSALYVSALKSSVELQPTDLMYGAHLGFKTTNYSSDLNMLDYVSLAAAKNYSNSPLARLSGWSTNKKVDFSDSMAMADFVAEKLFQGKIVGWFQGAAEFGPRALGHRSILMRPDKIETARRLSNHVKRRAMFRPYALSMTEHGASVIFDTKYKAEVNHSWMQYLVPVKEKWQEKVRAGLHVDLTTRPQVVTNEQDPTFFRLLTSFGAQFGVEALLNTSFNPSGYPLVTFPSEALAMFYRTDMDILVLGNTVISKEG